MAKLIGIGHWALFGHPTPHLYPSPFPSRNHPAGFHRGSPFRPFVLRTGQQPDAPAPHPRVCRADAHAAGNAPGGAADGPAPGAAAGQVLRLRPGRPRWVCLWIALAPYLYPKSYLQVTTRGTPRTRGSFWSTKSITLSGGCELYSLFNESILACNLLWENKTCVAKNRYDFLTNQLFAKICVI